jgi:hypothetical protein
MSPPTREVRVTNWRADNLGKRPVLPSLPPNPLAAGKRTARIAGGTEDPEGTFTSGALWSAVPGLLRVAVTVAAAATGKGGADHLPEGRDRVSATMLDSPVI